MHKLVAQAFVPVLILVVMEEGQRLDYSAGYWGNEKPVLILVVMEEGQRLLENQP